VEKLIFQEEGLNVDRSILVLLGIVLMWLLRVKGLTNNTPTRPSGLVFKRVKVRGLRSKKVTATMSGIVTMGIKKIAVFFTKIILALKWERV